MLEDFAALGVLITIAGIFAYTQAPPHWQTKTGFLLITLGWVPAGLVAIILLKHPLLLVPAVFVAGILFSSRRRAS